MSHTTDSNPSSSFDSDDMSEPIFFEVNMAELFSDPEFLIYHEARKKEALEHMLASEV